MRGLATGINEFAGYSGVATGALVTGYLAATYGLRPVPFYFGLAVILSGLGIAVVLTKETLHHARYEASLLEATEAGPGSAPALQPGNRKGPTFMDIFKLTTWGDPAMFATSQAGLLHKFADALVWVSFPLFFKSQALDVAQMV